MADAVTETSSSPRLRRSVLMAIAAIGMLVYAGVAVLADAPRLGSALRTLGGAGVLAILLLSLLNYLVRFGRWQLYIARLGQRLPPVQHALYYLSGFTYTVSPGKVGEALRSVYLGEHGVTLAMSFAAMFAERLLDLCIVLLLATFVGLSNPTYRPLVYAVAIVLVALGSIVASGQLPRWLRRLRTRFGGGESAAPAGPGRLARAMDALIRLLESSAQLLRPQMLLTGLLAGAIAWCAEGIGFQLICNGLGIPLSMTQAIGVYALALLAGNAAIFVPGGIGGTEIVMIALLTARGAPASAAVVATLLCRLATLWFAVVLGFLATAVLEFGPLRRRLPGAA